MPLRVSRRCTSVAPVSSALPAASAARGEVRCEPNSSSSDMSSSETIAYSVPTDGRERPVSICDSALGEISRRRASSRRLTPWRSRSERRRRPTPSWKSAVRSRRRLAPVDSAAIREPL